MMVVELAVNGEVVERVSVRNMGPTDPREGKSLYGRRTYQVRHWRGNDLSTVEVTHRRQDGALALAAKALQAVDQKETR